MNQEKLDQLQYPIGKFDWDAERSTEVLEAAIVKINNFPSTLNDTVALLPKTVLLHRYRPEGWTIAQVIHHVADSHMHSYLRFKHALLEDSPSIKDYEEAKWANLIDASDTEIEYSLKLIEALHYRWVLFLKNLTSRGYPRPVPAGAVCA